MNLINVKLILFREIRDQLRDRRTLFMMFVLPILLYPLLGMSFIQVQQFMHKKPVRVWVIGAKRLPEQPPLIVNNRFAADLFIEADETELLELDFARDEWPEDAAAAPDQRAEARRLVQAGAYDAALYFPEEFDSELERLQQTLEDESRQTGPLKIPCPEIIHTTANEKSQIALRRLSEVRDRWIEKVGEKILEARKVPLAAARPFRFETVDVAGKTAYRSAALWSKILPVLMLIWALTGAFYPAVDLCAGEKERGTLETLLCSPAERSEIVLGKLLTIMVFSILTAVLNLASVGLTGWLVFGHLAEFAPPPPLSCLWLAIALIPVSALFSALCLALAAFARSTKEGQYYLMPLLLITMPLALLPMAPGVELNLGNSLIPVSGVVLLLRSLLEGSYLPALRFLPVVVAVTLGSCLLALRWAVDQFNSESVLFREGEQLNVGLWLRHLLRDRQPTPTVAAALSCGVLILLIQFFVSSAARPPRDFGGLARLALASQLVVIATPALLMTVILTRSPRRTLLLKRPRWPTIPAALLLAVVLHPAVGALQAAVTQLYPISEAVQKLLLRTENLLQLTPFWQKFLVIALLPAVCEELAFRGFVLSGFRHLGHKWRAIVYTSVLFGLAHGILQQSLTACLVGVVIGYVAVQSGSILPCVLFHLLHNTLALAMKIIPQWLDRCSIRGTSLRDILMAATETGDYVYHWPVVVAGGSLALCLLFWFGRLPYGKSAEEELQEAIHRGPDDEDP